MRRRLIWLLITLGWIITLVSLYLHHLYAQPVWEPEGLRRFLLFTGGYAVIAGPIAWRAPRWLLPALGAFALVSASVMVGPLAPLALVYLLLGCYALGAAWFRSEPPVAMLFGLAVCITLVMFSAAWRIHYSLLYWLLPAGPIALAARRGWMKPPALRASPRLAVALFPLAGHWLLALKPEASSDGLAMHAVIAARMATAHAWPFNPTEFAWALMPMGGDWAWSIAWQLAGDACARLLNVALLGLIAWMLLRRLRGWSGALVVAAFLATPLTQHVTGSLFIENVVAAMILGTVVMFARKAAPWRLGGCVLAGVAMASKFGALAFAVPLLVLAARRGALIAVAIGSVPYLNAWARTGNPFFPFFNARFQSPFYPLENFRDLRFETPLTWTTFYDLTFHTSRFVEGQDGGAGFLFFLLLPAALVALRKKWAAVALLVGVAGSVLTLIGQSNLRYTYAAMPLIALGAGVLLRQQAGATAALALVLNLSLLPAAGWYHKGFFETREETLLRSAPERRLVEWLNTNAPSSAVAWLEGNAIGDFRGRAYTNSWHSDSFVRRLRACGSATDVAKLMAELRVRYVILPSDESGRAISNVYTREYAEEWTQRVLAFGGVELRRVLGTGKAPAAVWAGPGEYDEITRATRFAGAWTRDLQFASAYRGTLVYTNAAGAAAEVRFRGRAVKLKYTAASNRCRARVELDGREWALDQHSALTRWQAESEWYEASREGEHVLRLSGAAGGCYVDLDGFTVR